MVVGNSANMHIFSYFWIFIGNIEPIVTNKVAKIGGNDLNLNGIDVVLWSWVDEKFQLH